MPSSTGPTKSRWYPRCTNRVPLTWPMATTAPRARSRATGDPAAIAEAAQLLAAAKRPVILAGGGVIAAAATPELISVAELLGAPVTHSFQGKGAFPADHDLYAWPCGDMGSIPG